MEKVNNPANPTAVDREVLITRVVNAPSALVFKLWTDAKHLSNWFAPQGCTIHFEHIDIRPGGTFHSCVHTPNYGDCWSIGAYKEIKVPELLVFTMAVSDAQGNKITAEEAGKPGSWPIETLITVMFDEYEGRTKITLRQTVSEALAQKTGAYAGWIDMFNRLAETLSIAIQSLKY